MKTIFKLLSCALFGHKVFVVQDDIGMCTRCGETLVLKTDGSWVSVG